MQTILKIAELGGLLGLTFSVAVLLEWALLRVIFGAVAARLRPARIPVRQIAIRKVQR